LNEHDLEAWLEGYLGAWSSNDPQDIGALFTENALYYTAPFREPWRGRDAIAQEWIDRKDDPGTWDFDHRIIAIAGDVGFVQGQTRYKDGPSYSNLWVIRLGDEGRCSEYTEWWMEES
jgi:ketosteroid isomerase-like protein